MTFISKAAFIAATLVSTSAFAATTINSISGTWTGAAPANNLSGLNTDTIQWGGSNGARSSYSFGAAGTPLTVEIDEVFDLGQFTHNNQAITAGTSITTATLEVNVVGDIDGTAFNLTSVFNFDHDETPNSGALANCPYPNSQTVCDDNVSATLNVGQSQGIMVGDREYFFTISGFEYGGGVFDSFLTAEGFNNTAVLKGSLSVAPVPVPASVALLLGGVGALGAAARRKKKSA
ncbi:THxN family PEP-CTERM protein [Paracoccaceae bacterium GXU_MW_L88]